MVPSSAMVQVKCKNCRKFFSARVADRKRGWARFCSKSCKAAKQERRTHQNANYWTQTVDTFPSMVSGVFGHGQE